MLWEAVWTGVGLGLTAAAAIVVALLLGWLAILISMAVNRLSQSFKSRSRGDRS